MKDNNKKSKAQLIQELAELHRRVAAFEAIPFDDRRIKENQKSRAFINQTLHQSSNAIFTFDLEGRIQRVNQKGVEITGYSLEELINSPLSAIFSLEALPQTSEKFIKVSIHGETVTGHETEISRKDGNTRAVIFHIAPFYKAGKITGIVGTTEDISKQKSIERALVENEARFHRFIDASTDAILGMDEQGRINVWNEAATSMFGYETSEAIGRNLHKLIVPERYHSKAAKGLKAFAESGQGAHIGKVTVCEALRKDGTEFPVELSISSFRKDAAWHATAIIRDVTEHRQEENALRVIQARHDEAQRIAHLGHWTLDLIKDELIWSDENYRIFGVEPGTANTYETFLKIVHPDDYEFVDKAYTGSVKNRIPYDIEHRLLMQDGSIKWVNERCETEYADDGTPLRSIGTTLDITELKQAGEALRASEEQTRLLLDSTAEAIYGLDLNGNCTLANAACLNMLGYDDISELTGKNMHELIHHTRRDGSSYPMKECVIYQSFCEGKGTHVDDEVFWHKDGSSFPVSYWSYPVYKDEQITGSVVTFLDITEQVKSRDALAESREQLRASLEGTIAAVGKSVEARDPYTAGHQQKVAELAVAIARDMGLDEDRVEGIRMGASIHDIGKIHLPAEILSKPSKLSDIEYSLIQAHPQVGYDILKDIAFPWPVADITHQHHEHMDGSGYPQGLKGEEICLEARIVAVADVVEAISSHRPYRPALGIDAAMDEIKMQRGKFYDPEVVDACLRLFSENRFSF
jgi:PAS domain S-box-containing protein/putative nucleotidyltransferase with HDIG domain